MEVVTFYMICFKLLKMVLQIIIEDFGCHFVFEDKNYERQSEILDHNLGMRLDNHTYNNIHILGLIVYREMKIIKF